MLRYTTWDRCKTMMQNPRHPLVAVAIEGIMKGGTEKELSCWKQRLAQSLSNRTPKSELTFERIPDPNFRIPGACDAASARLVRSIREVGYKREYWTYGPSDIAFARSLLSNCPQTAQQEILTELSKINPTLAHIL